MVSLIMFAIFSSTAGSSMELIRYLQPFDSYGFVRCFLLGRGTAITILKFLFDSWYFYEISCNSSFSMGVYNPVQEEFLIASSNSSYFEQTADFFRGDNMEGVEARNEVSELHHVCLSRNAYCFLLFFLVRSSPCLFRWRH